MRILMLDNEFPPLGGGMGTVNLALLDRLVAYEDIEVDLVTSALGIRREQTQFSRGIRIFKVPVLNRNPHHSSNRELVTYAALAFPVALALHRAKQYDLCLAWSTVPAGGVALALWKLVGLTYLIWVSGPDIPGFEQRYERLYPVLTPAIRTIWCHAARVIAKCNDEIEMIRAVGGHPNITVIPNGVDIVNFRPRQRIPDKGPLEIVCSGRLIERKGQNHLIEAVQRLRSEGVDINLTLIGTGDAMDSYRLLANRLGVSDRVHFTGYVPREIIAQRYAQAHIFALPSYNEGMSLATLEAMASGLPVIVTRSGTGEIVEEGLNGFVVRWADVNALCEALRQLAFDRDLARRMGAASRERSLQYAWDGVVESYLMLFSNLRSSDPQT